MKAYIVTSGSYSDYKIHAIFLKKVDAENYIHNCYTDIDEPDIEEYEIGEDVKKKRPYWFGAMNRDGSLRLIRKGNNIAKAYITFQFHPMAEYTYISFLIDAKSEEHAIKIINEKRTQIIANGMWDNPEQFPDYNKYLISPGGSIEIK